MSNTNAFAPLLRELDHWAAAGTAATLWWRDDDCIAPTAALDRMIALSAVFQVPLGLAVIPAKVEAALAQRLLPERTVFVLQHGYAHINHAAKGERAAEFGAQRPLELRAADLSDGWQRLSGLPRRLPVFVPPWNRYDGDIAPALARAGMTVISAFGATRPLSSGMVEHNCHCDIISWRTTRGFTGTEKSVAMIQDHLISRRTGSVASDVTGLLTHHLDHDSGCWSFLEALFTATAGHPGARWISPAAFIRPAGV